MSRDFARLIEERRPARNDADRGQEKTMTNVARLPIAAPGINIEKGIPLPERTQIGGRPRKWPYQQMEVGDSFAVPLKKGETPTKAMTRTRYSSVGKALSRKFVVRSLTENGVRVVRVWRVA